MRCVFVYTPFLHQEDMHHAVPQQSKPPNIVLLLASLFSMSQIPCYPRPPSLPEELPLFEHPKETPEM